MSPSRFTVVILLLLGILVLASVVFALLTYWLGPQVLPEALGLHNTAAAAAALLG